jgi:hypothetical protein
LFGWLRSSGLALTLLLAIAVIASVATVSPPDTTGAAPGVAGVAGSVARVLGLRRTFSSPLFLTLVGLLAANVVACTWHRARTRLRADSSWPRFATDVALHVALLALMAGGLAKALFGFTGTQNVYVGDATRTVYDWRAHRDSPLGFTLAVDEFRTGYYPIRAKVGLRKAATGEKIALLEIVEGGEVATPLGDLRIGIAGYDPDGQRLRLSVVGREGRRELTFPTEGAAAAVKSGDYDLTLVAYRADIREIGATISLHEEGARVAGGWVDSRTRIAHRGLSLFLTAWGTDPEGRRYCGIQVVRDPGALFFWAGCTLFVLATTLHLVLKSRRPA